MIELDPFIIDTSRDVGYVAENTLAGNRLNTRLADTPSSVAVFTREFLDDLAISDMKGLVQYTLNSEVDYAASNAGNAQNSIINA
jgi:iron complex outermembrane receptor protein